MAGNFTFSADTETLVLTLTSHIGGAERSLLEFLRYVPERARSKIGVVLPDMEGALAPTVTELGYEVTTCELPVECLPVPQPVKYAAYVRELRRLIRAASIETVYANNLTLGPLLTPLKVLTPDVRTVIHVRDDRRPVGLLFRNIVLQDEVIFNSEFVRNKGLRFPVSSSVFGFEPHVVYNSVDVSAAERRVQSGSSSTRSADSALTLGMFGRFVPWKGFDFVIENCCRSELYRMFDRFLVVGAQSGLGDPRYERKLRKLVEKHDPEDKFEIREFEENVWPAYAECDLVVVPSENEPFGRIPIEAGALSIPVLVADSGGLKETVKGGETGYLFDPNSPAAFERRLRELLADESLRDRLGNALKADVETRFSSERYYEEIGSIVLGRGD